MEKRLRKTLTNLFDNSIKPYPCSQNLSPQLPADCLEDIFNYLSDDTNSLFSCLLVNKLCCQIVIRILWRNPWDLDLKLKYKRVNSWTRITRTLISLISDTSRQSLKRNGVEIQPLTQLSSPRCNYLAFCKSLSLKGIHRVRREILDLIPLSNIERAHKEDLVEKEIYKSFLERCYSLKYLQLLDVPLIDCPGATSSLSNLYELECNADISSKTFLELSKICHHIQIININLCDNDNKGLATLIKSQKHLKELKIQSPYRDFKVPLISNAITTLSGSLICIRLINNICILPQTLHYLPNIKVLELDLTESQSSYDYLKSVNLPNLEILDVKFDEVTPFYIYTNLISTTKNSLKKININHWCTVLPEEIQPYLHSIIKNCNKSLQYVTIWSSRHVILDIKQLLISCDSLKTIIFESLNENDDYNNGKEILRLLGKFASHDLIELRFNGKWNFDVMDLLEFLEIWKHRKTSLSLRFDIYPFTLSRECINLIDKYRENGILKSFSWC
ncbi:10862_t:CDS:1 [Dentiscutata erythropus]|uniref:10862_t:CDS:1 n=1 Tax=Dentiscutata erythropus TaxID=1348616 RepID=A0A9N9NEJ7_9GLOM|nr:10862_t:CDS:1 [Dentiscutata erythropus]